MHNQTGFIQPFYEMIDPCLVLKMSPPNPIRAPTRRVHRALPALIAEFFCSCPCLRITPEQRITCCETGNTLRLTLCHPTDRRNSDLVAFRLKLGEVFRQTRRNRRNDRLTT